jgi:hypothetical protein
VLYGLKIEGKKFTNLNLLYGIATLLQQAVFLNGKAATLNPEVDMIPGGGWEGVGGYLAYTPHMKKS